MLDFKLHTVRRGAAGIDVYRLGRLVADPVRNNGIVKHVPKPAQTELDALDRLIIDSQVRPKARFGL